MGASAQKIPAWQRVDFIGKTRVWFALSGVVLLIGIASLGYQGLNLGIDFKGGSQITFKTPQAHSVQDVRGEAASLGLGDAVIQGRGTPASGGYKEFQVRTRSLSLQTQNDLQSALETKLATIEAAAQKAAEGVDVQADLQGSVEYKSHLCRVFARRALEAAVKRAKG